MKRYYRILLMVAASIFLNSTMSQASGLDTPIYARFQNFYLDETITILIKNTKMSGLVCGQVRGSVSQSFDNVPLSQAMRKLAQENRLIWTANEDIITVRPVTKIGMDALVVGNVVKVPLIKVLKALADTFDKKLVLSGTFEGQVTQEVNGTFRQVMDSLAAKHNFTWSVKGKIIKISSKEYVWQKMLDK